MLLLHLGIAVCLGFADIVQTYTLASLGLRRSYHAVFWLEVGFAATALVILVSFVKIKRAESEMTVDEREEIERKEKDERCDTATTGFTAFGLSPPRTRDGEGLIEPLPVHPALP